MVEKDKVTEHIEKEDSDLIIGNIVNKEEKKKKKEKPISSFAKAMYENDYEPKKVYNPYPFLESRHTVIPKEIPRELVEQGIISPWGNDIKNWNKIGARNQSTWNTLARGVGGLGVNIVAGVIDAVGSYDVAKYLYDKAMDNGEKTYSNQLHQWSNDLKEWMSKEYPIYNSERNDVFTAEWAGKFLQTTGYSLGLMFPELALHAAALYATGGSGNVALAVKTARTVKTLWNLNAAKKALQLALKKKSTIQNLAISAGFGVGQGLKTARLNSMFTYEQSFQEYKALGYSDEYASEKASAAADLGFNIEVLPSILINSAQFMTISRYRKAFKKNPDVKTPELRIGTSGIIEGAGSVVEKRIKSKAGKKLLKYGIAFGSEAVEETGEEVASKEAQYQVNLESGIIGEHTFYDRTLTGYDTRDSFLMGGASGFLFRLMGTNLNKYMKKGSKSAKDEKDAENIDFVKELSNVNMEIGEIEKEKIETEEKIENIKDPKKSNKLKEAYTSIKSELKQLLKKRKNLKRQERRRYFFQNLQFDYAVGKGNNLSYELFLSQMQEIVTALEGTDTEILNKVLKKYDIDKNDTSDILEIYKEFLGKTDEYKKKVDEKYRELRLKFVEENEPKNDYSNLFNIATKIVEDQWVLEDLEKENASYREDIQEVLAENNLTSVSDDYVSLLKTESSLAGIEELGTQKTKDKEEYQALTQKRKELFDKIKSEKKDELEDYASESKRENKILKEVINGQTLSERKYGDGINEDIFSELATNVKWLKINENNITKFQQRVRDGGDFKKMAKKILEFSKRNAENAVTQADIQRYKDDVEFFKDVDGLNVDVEKEEKFIKDIESKIKTLEKSKKKVIDDYIKETNKSIEKANFSNRVEETKMQVAVIEARLTAMEAHGLKDSEEHKSLIEERNTIIESSNLTNYEVDTSQTDRDFIHSLNKDRKYGDNIKFFNEIVNELNAIYDIKDKIKDINERIKQSASDLKIGKRALEAKKKAIIDDFVKNTINKLDLFFIDSTKFSKSGNRILSLEKLSKKNKQKVINLYAEAVIKKSELDLNIDKYSVDKIKAIEENINNITSEIEKIAKGNFNEKQTNDINNDTYGFIYEVRSLLKQHTIGNKDLKTERDKLVKENKERESQFVIGKLQSYKT